RRAHRLLRTLSLHDALPICVWEVRGARGYVGLFFGDYFSRPTKRSGAWMTTLRDREKLTGDVRPLVINVMNFAQAGDGEPTLLRDRKSTRLNSIHVKISYAV